MCDRVLGSNAIVWWVSKSIATLILVGKYTMHMPTIENSPHPSTHHIPLLTTSLYSTESSTVQATVAPCA